MEILDLKDFKPLDKSIIVTNKLAETLKVETIYTLSKNKTCFQYTISKGMGFDTIINAEYETDMGLSYHVINKDKTKAYKIYHFDKNNSTSVKWLYPDLDTKRMIIGHPKFVPATPDGWTLPIGFNSGIKESFLRHKYDYIMFNENDNDCILKSLYLQSIFEDLGT